jgi:Ser/Thr protein kinase RdoA (MazF antagonist)
MMEIEPILRCYGRDSQPSHVESLGSAGGLSGAQLWRLVAPRGVLVLRRWPVEHPTPDGLRFIHAVLGHAANRGLNFLPVPIAATDGATFASHAGHLWELAPWMLGTADYEQSPRADKLRAAMTALAVFHNAVADFPASPPLASSLRTAPAVTTRLARLRELQSGGADTLFRAITDSHWPELAPLARQLLATLPRVVPLVIGQLAPLADVPFALQPCIRDVWHDHVLFDGDRVTGFVDFGGMQIDTPATDVARLLGSLVGDKPAGRRDGLAAYAAVRPLSEQEAAAVTALDAAGTVLAGVNWIRWIYLDGRQFENHLQVVHRFGRILVRLQSITCDN